MYTPCLLQDSLQEQTTQNSFVPYGYQDILNTAIRRLEHPSHVCAARVGVTISQYFRHASCGSNSLTTSINPPQLVEIIGTIKEEWKREVEEDTKLVWRK